MKYLMRVGLLHSGVENIHALALERKNATFLLRGSVLIKMSGKDGGMNRKDLHRRMIMALRMEERMQQ